MKRKYIYNPHQFQEILEKHHIKQVELQRLFNYKNTITIRGWRDGNPIYADKICEICNAFGIDIHEFFVPDEEEGNTYKGEFRSSLEEKARVRHESERTEDEGGGCISVETLLEHLEIAREKERTYQEGLRDKDRQTFDAMLREKEQRMDTQLMQMNEKILEEQKLKNEAILAKKELEMKMEELTRQYKELELQLNTTSFKGAISGIAEEHTYLPKNL